MKLARKAVWISALASALVLIASSTAVAAITPVPVSGLSPVPGCASTDAAQPGRNFLNAEVEPQIAVDGSNIITMYHQDRWSNGGGHAIGVSRSSDGGATWTKSAMPWNSCAPGIPSGTPSSLTGYLRASDPWVSFGPDGIAYASALAFNILVPNWANAVVVARSKNGGAWDHVGPIPGSAFTQFAQSTDKNSTTADPTKKKTAYTVWDTLIEPTDHPDDNPHTAAYTGPAYFSKTTDGGETWSQAKIIVNTGNRQQTIGNIIVVGPDGTLYNFTALLLPPNTPFQGTRSNTQLAFVKSTDGGDHWTQPQIIAPFNSLGVRNPNNTSERLRVGDGLEEVAIDPISGKIYVVYESSTNYQKQLKQSSGAWDDEILLVTSSDKGVTWQGPSVVHHLSSGLPTFTPTVAVNGGRVAVTYYDTRNLTPNQTANLPTDYWVKYSTDGGLNFGNEQHIAGSFDSRTAPVARGFFLGDYEGLQPSGSGFQAAFVKTNCNASDPDTGQVFTPGGLCAAASSNTAPTSNTNPTDVFVATLS